LFGGIMAPPRLGQRDLPEGTPNADQPTRHQLYRALPRFFELGTVYALVAGLLNVLAIYDAVAGPVLAEPRPRKHDDTEGDAGHDEDDD
jgi:hypothetical protein